MTLRLLIVALLLVPQHSFGQLMPADRERILRSYIPKLSSPEGINEKLAGAILFTDAEIPPAYQVRVGNRTAFYSTQFRFDGQPGPCDGLRWCFPAGALVFDCLLKSFSDGTWACYTVRMRLREIDDWDADSYVPFANVGCLKEYGGDTGTVTMRELAEHERHSAASRTFWVYELQPIANARNLLRLKAESGFEPQSGIPFMVTDGHEVHAPTPADPNDHDNVVPAGYLASAIGSDRESCRFCHRDTLAPVRVQPQSSSMEFISESGPVRISKVKAFWLPPSPDGGRWPIVAWLGPLKPGYVYEEGCDGIRTIHPIEPSTIGPPIKQPRLRQAFLDAGLVAWYDPAKHPPEVYRQILAFSNY